MIIRAGVVGNKAYSIIGEDERCVDLVVSRKDIEEQEYRNITLEFANRLLERLTKEYSYQDS